MYELTKVIIVGKNKNLIFAASQIVIPGFKSFNNSQKLLFMSFVASLSGNYFLRKKTY